MNKPTILLISAALCMGGSAFAQSKLDLGGRASLRQAKVMSTTKSGARFSKAKQASAEAPLHAFVTLNSGFTAADLEEIPGLEIQGGRGSKLMVEFATDALEALENSAAVKSIQLERAIDAKLNIARALSGIDKIHSGEALPQPYTGKGVICALVDGGFDPNHVNFVNEDGTSRIENFTYFRPLQSGGYNTETYGADYIPNIDTESSETFHGTHTMGIMTGSYRGKVKAGVLGADNRGYMVNKVEEIDNPYYGIAPDAGISVASGAGTDYYVALGISQILNYAYWKAEDTKQQIPVCLNLSIGSNVGPHDGTSTLCRYIDEEVGYSGDGVSFIPVIASGNEGDLKIAVNKVLSADDDQLKTTFLSKDLYGGTGTYPNALYGQVYIYSDSELPFEVQAVIINKERDGRVALQNALSAAPEGAQKYICSSSEYVQDSETDKVSPQLATNFEGYLGVMAQLDVAESGRYLAVVDMMLFETAANNGKYCVGLIVKGEPGQRIDAYCTGDWFDFSDQGLAANGYLDGSTDGTISDIACGKSSIVVGSYNARNYWGNVDGTIGGYEDDMFSNNKVSDFTSYGTLADGRTLPHICAPGATIISSSNEYYIKDNKVGDENIQATFTDGTRRYSWHQCVGTSMATPVVTGSIALWMEANPELTVDEAREIIQKTATVDSDVKAGNPVQWGAGKFNAYEGLKEVLERKAASIEGITTSGGTNLLVRQSSGAIEVTLPGATELNVTLYSTSGRTVASTAVSGNSASLSTSALPAGVYILNANGNSEKLIIK
ncbi:MAG: S8 family serine peptidase [Bacteroidales bacterium]|nr:S8 family serine peptidase [Bacteroidales bacterium]